MSQQANKPKNIDLRQFILNTALDIVGTEGIKRLTQPRLAKMTGLRQSHLTYYFPKKSDLFLALLEALHKTVRANEKAQKKPLVELLKELFFEPERMSFFLTAILEAGNDRHLQHALHEHMANFREELTRDFNNDKTKVTSFMDELRGIALRALLEPKIVTEAQSIIEELAKQKNINLK